MTNTYTRKIRLTIPPAMADIGAAIGRAMDADSGGAFSFSEDETTGKLVCETLCTETFFGQASAMLSNPAALHSAVSADYAARWGEMVPPTLAECQAFCEGAVIPEPSPPANEP